MPAWSSIRPDRKILREEEVKILLDNIKGNDRHSTAIKCLVSILYLYGCRISEALLAKKSDIEIDSSYMWITFVTLKKRKKKPKNPARRDKPIPADRTLNVRLDSPFVENIVSHISTLQNDDKLFKFSYPTAYRKIVWCLGLDKESRETSMKEINVWLHLFRDTCLTQLAYAGANPSQLKVWAGWSSLAPSDRYIEKSKQMIEELANLRARRGYGKYTELKPIDSN